jgi:hypothetical protein
MANLGSSIVYGLLRVTGYIKAKVIEVEESLTVNGSRVLTTADEGSGNGIDSDTLDGMQPTDQATGTTIMQRDGSGETWARLFRSNYSTTNATIAGIYTTRTIGGDYMRPSTPTQVRNSMGLPNITTGTTAPSSPQTNDIWIDIS